MRSCFQSKPQNFEEYTVSDFHKATWPKSLTVQAATASAAFLCVIGGTVIFASCLCLTLPGTNVVTTMLLHGIVPGACCIGVSIPLIITSFFVSRKITPLRKECVRHIVYKFIAKPNLDYSPERAALEIKGMNETLNKPYKRLSKMEKKLKTVEDEKRAQLEKAIKKQKKELKKAEEVIKDEKDLFFDYFTDKVLLNPEGHWDRFWYKQYNAQLIEDLKKLYKETTKCSRSEISKKEAKIAKEMETLLGELKNRIQSPNNFNDKKDKKKKKKGV